MEIIKMIKISKNFQLETLRLETTLMNIRKRNLWKKEKSILERSVFKRIFLGERCKLFSKICTTIITSIH